MLVEYFCSYLRLGNVFLVSRSSIEEFFKTFEYLLALDAIPDINCKKFNAVLSPESIASGFAFIRTIFESLLKEEPSLTYHSISAFLSIILKDS